MKVLATSAFLLLSFSLRAQTQDPNAVRDKPEVHLQLKDGETHFTRGGFAHIASNLADTPFRNVTIELLKPQGEANNKCGNIIAGQGFAICDPAPVPVTATTQSLTVRPEQIRLTGV